jgi:hypothetical protein
LEKYVTVAGFSIPVQAEIARGRLESEGIPAFVTGGLTASTFFGLRDLGGRIDLCVPAEHVSRAIQILSACGDAEHLTDEVRGEWADEGPVWVCSLCGDTVRAVLPLCPACHTPRGQAPDFDPEEGPDDEGEEGIQKAPIGVTGNTRPASRPAEEGVKGPVELTHAPPAPEPVASAEAVGDVVIPPPATAFGDARARQALRASLLGLLIPIGVFTLYSAWTLAAMIRSRDLLSPRGEKDLYLAMAFDAVFGACVLVLCAGLA